MFRYIYSTSGVFIKLLEESHGRQKGCTMCGAKGYIIEKKILNFPSSAPIPVDIRVGCISKSERLENVDQYLSD